MSCFICRTFRQLIINLALMADHVANTLLLGNPNDTLSIRFARAADHGERWAQTVCKVLGWFSPHHCQNAETKKSEGADIWHW